MIFPVGICADFNQPLRTSQLCGAAGRAAGVTDDADPQAVSSALCGLCAQAGIRWQPVGGFAR